jgi:ElaB/YqjD/DUF883 family membrane-anchored ribosome-binding protein
MSATATATDTKADTPTLRHLLDEADEFLKQARDSGDERIDALRRRFADQVRELHSQIEQLEDDARYKARAAARRADRAVHEHPYGAIGAAAAVGLVIGFLAGRRS